MSFDEQRKHIHDMANSLSIVDASVSRVITLLKRNHPELTDELTRLGKADEYSKKAIATLNGLREVVHTQLKELNP